MSDKSDSFKTYAQRIYGLSIHDYSIFEIAKIDDLLLDLDAFQRLNASSEKTEKIRADKINETYQYDKEAFTLIREMLQEPISKSKDNTPRGDDFRGALFLDVKRSIEQCAENRDFDSLTNLFFKQFLLCQTQSAFLPPMSPTAYRSYALHYLFYDSILTHKPVILGELQSTLDEINSVCMWLQNLDPRKEHNVNTITSAVNHGLNLINQVQFYIERFLFYFHIDDDKFDISSMESTFEREMNVTLVVGSAETREDLENYFEVIKCRNKAIQVFENLQSNIKQCVDTLSSFQEKIDSVKSNCEGNVFHFKSHIPTELLLYNLSVQHLLSSIKTSKNQDAAIDSFEKLLILDPRKVTKKESSKISSICAKRTKETNDFMGDLGLRIGEINLDMGNAPEGKSPFFKRVKYLLLSILCAAALAIFALISMEMIPLPEDVLLFAGMGAALVVIIGCIIIGIITLGFIVGFFAGCIGAGILINLAFPALVIGCIVFLVKALAPSGKKRKARKEYLDGVKKDIKEPLDHVHLIRKQLEKVDAGIDLSAIKAYYADAAKTLTSYQNYQ